MNVNIIEMNKYIPNNQQVQNIYKWEKQWRSHLKNMHTMIEQYVDEYNVPELMENIDYTTFVNYLYNYSFIYWSKNVLNEYNLIKYDYTE